MYVWNNESPFRSTTKVSIYKIPEGFGWRQGLPKQLLKDESVQKDLELTANEAYLLTIGNEPELEKLLSPQRQIRLQQIHLQKAKLDALSDVFVGQALVLSTEQKRRILDVLSSEQKAKFEKLKGKPLDGSDCVRTPSD